MQINTWLQHQGFGFYDHKTFFDEYNLLGRGGIHLCRKGRQVLGVIYLRTASWKQKNSPAPTKGKEEGRTIHHPGLTMSCQMCLKAKKQHTGKEKPVNSSNLGCSVVPDGQGKEQEDQKQKHLQAETKTV